MNNDWRLILSNFADQLKAHADDPASDLRTNVARLRQIARLLEALHCDDELAKRAEIAGVA